MRRFFFFVFSMGASQLLDIALHSSRSFMLHFKANYRDDYFHDQKELFHYLSNWLGEFGGHRNHVSEHPPRGGHLRWYSCRTAKMGGVFMRQMVPFRVRKSNVVRQVELWATETSPLQLFDTTLLVRSGLWLLGLSSRTE
ncbi:hypothetical protein F4808DRAFT_81376 [Astrocystis sublimbata]|nr:hypothetical protein F4808DRAFT_81376 [Astrocystis sublimbata]